ncbi:MAG: hypothetical protein WKH64_02170 [Chloroflexia bacterium]
MLTPIVLRGVCFTLTLEPSGSKSRLDRYRNWFVGALTLSSDVSEDLPDLKITSEFPHTDLERLCSRADEHMSALARNHNHDDHPTWGTLDWDFTIQFLDGMVERQEDTLDGVFSVQVVLLYELSPNPGDWLKGGYEGRVKVEEMIRFCASVREYVNSWRQG